MKLTQYDPRYYTAPVQQLPSGNTESSRVCAAFRKDLAPPLVDADLSNLEVRMFTWLADGKAVWKGSKE